MDATTGENVVLESNYTESASLNAVMEQKSAPTFGLDSSVEMPVVNDTSAIARFLSREVSIGTYQWNIGTPLFVRLNPWQIFLDLPQIKDKIRYYSRLKANMCVRLNISGTPFHYGMCMLTYRPHAGLDNTADSVYNLSVALENSRSAEALKIVESQLSGVKFHPGYDTSVELKVPYVHFKPGIQLGTSDPNSIGVVSLVELAPLQHANAGTSSVTIEVLACMTNVVLDVPTAIPLGFDMDAAIKKVGKIFEVGAKATHLAQEYVPTALTLMAKLGFSRPASNEPPVSMRHIPFQMANYDLHDSVERLALAADSEADISGLSVGTDGSDELLVSTIAERPSYLARANWDNTMVKGDFLLGSIVTPVQGDQGIYSKPSVSTTAFQPVDMVVQTPVGFVASMFTHAKFEMVYKYTVVCSPYHKGRLRVWYDPNPAAFVTPPLNLTNSVIIDLAESCSAEVSVPWQSVRDSAKLDDPFTANTFDSVAAYDLRCSAAATTPWSHNGVIVCEVLNKLTAPIDVTSVVVLLEVSARNFVGYGPTLPVSNNVPAVSEFDATPYTPLGYDVSCGDSVASLRQLMKRYCAAYTVMMYSRENGLMRESYAILPTFLPAPGYHEAPESLDTTPLSRKINYTVFTFRSYVSQAFLLARGSIRWKMMVQRRVEGSSGTAMASVERYRSPTLVPRTGSYPVVFQTNSDAIRSGQTSSAYAALGPRAGGLQLCDTQAQLGFMDVEFPFVSSLRAYNTRAPMSVDAGDELGEMNALIRVSQGPKLNDNNYAMVKIHEAVGEDFNVFYFMHAPALLRTYPATI